MTEQAYAGLRRAARAGEAETETPPNNQDENGEEEAKSSKKKKDHKMTEESNASALAAATSAGAKATHERFAAVMASNHYAGREPLAMKLLGNDKLSADEIIDTLSVAEAKPAPVAADPALSQEAAEEAGRKEMQAALGATTNSNLDASGSSAPAAGTKASDVWGSAHANLCIASNA